MVDANDAGVACPLLAKTFPTTVVTAVAVNPR